MELALTIAFFLIIAFAAPRWGVDSRFRRIQ
jgi:hypothetical protein